MSCPYNKNPDSKYSRAYLIVVHLGLGLALATFVALFFGFFVMLLWNYVVPAVFLLQPITYGQAVALLVLARLLVGGLSKHGHKFRDSHHRNGEARRDYDEWWQEVGKQSFEEFTQKKGD
jgi:hypothetical protein